MVNPFEGKTILVTGGAGSIGSELVRKLIDLNPKAVRVLDNDEARLFHLEQELSSEEIRIFIGDVRDKDRLRLAVEDVDLVFHAAALKHVPLCEYNPFEAVKTNVIGTQNLLEVAREEDVDKFILVSTDKAVDPSSVMGATKLLAEKLTISANLYKGKKRTVFSCVRFGNVLGSSGSVVPLFKQQIREKKCITITDPEMTRFVMTSNEAVNLILKATELAEGGEIFIFKMPAVKLTDLAEVIIEEYAPKCGMSPDDVQIKIIGKRPGEKTHEALLTESEIGNAYESEDMFILCPYGNEITYPANKIYDVHDYSSKDAYMLSKEEIRKKLASLL